MTNEEKVDIRNALEKALSEARLKMAVSEQYEEEAEPALVAAKYLLRGAGINRSTEELRAMLVRREGLFVAEDYAKAAVRELLPEETQDGEAADA